jgi:SAM-dependent methyltransferase
MRLELLVKAGKIKRILDAGAGSCTLEGELRRKGYLKTVHIFLAFGAYDCSMLRICAEHGSISFQHNWFIPLPVCAACKFDLIHQFAGMNHMKTVDQHDNFLSNMLALLECNGVLFVNDHTAREVWTVLLRQVLELKREQKLAQYVENKDGYFEISRNC